jgi:hypothetical protein
MGHSQHYTRVTFGQMPIGTQFRSTPTTTAYGWLKVSTRTARINGNGKVYYVRQNEVQYVESAHWAEMLGQSLTGGADV